jgi:regulatory protein
MNDAPVGESSPTLEQAKDIALRRLTTRARSRAELRRDLISRKVSGVLADEVLERFTELGLLSDIEFARQWIRERRTSRSLSDAALKRDLLATGVESALVDEALAESDGEDDETAIAFARKKMASMTGANRDVVMRRLNGQLARRGFSPAVVLRAVFRVVEDMDGGVGNITDDE